MARHVRKGDRVRVMAGKHRGLEGVITEVLVEKNRVRVEGIEIIRHLKPSRDGSGQEGGRLTRPGSIHISNVLPIDPTDGKATRVGWKIDDNGNKVRVSRRTQNELPTASA